MVAPPKVEVASYNVQINVRDGRCVLTYDGPHKGQVETDLPPPCEFSRGHRGSIQTRDFKNRGTGGGHYTVILVIGGPLNTAHSDEFMKDGCGTQVQPFSLSPRGVALGDAETLLIVCPLGDLDTAVFGFSARPV